MADSNADPKPIAEISHGPSAFEQFLDKNQKWLVVLGSVIAIAAAAYVVKDGVDRGAREDGGKALVDAESTEELKAVIDQHASTPAAQSAAVILSDRQWEEGQQTESLETLRGEIAANPDHPATIPAKARLAARLRETGNNAEAKSQFEDIVASPEASWIAPYALISLAEIARAEGDEEAADSYLEEAKDKYPGSAFSTSVQNASRFIDFTMPAEIEAAAAPAEEAVQLPEMPDVTTGSVGDSTNPLLENLNMDPADTSGLPEESPDDSGPAGE